MCKRWASNIYHLLKSKSKTAPPVPAAVWTNPLYFIAFGFGSGIAPIAPGTFGTLMAIPFYIVIRHLPPTGYLIFLVLFIAVSSWLCDYISRQIHAHDHPGMCIDEFVGFFVTMLNAPRGWQWIALGFILFRLFDIWKPWPIRYLDENVQGGFGMVIDDVMAGLYAMVIMQALITLL